MPVRPADVSAALNGGAGPRRGNPWMINATRVLTFRPPRWEELDARPITVAALIVISLLITVVLQRPFFTGTVHFYWKGLLNGWAGTVISVWLCWLVLRSATHRALPSPSVSTLFMLLGTASLMVSVLMAFIGLLMLQIKGDTEVGSSVVSWLMTLAPLIWIGLADIRLLWRLAGTPIARMFSVLTIPLLLVIAVVHPPVIWWSEAPTGSAAEVQSYNGIPLTEDVIAVQSQLLAQALNAVQPSQPGRVNLYAITYAPYASQDVFMRESATVANTMAERFGARNRTIQLVLNPATATTLPWATRPNLRKAIQRMAAVMDPDNDVLFLHLTSHGAKSGELAVDAWPLESESVTPALLKQWLDEAGVHGRVISISACYAGSWIEPLASDDTLVMTAADATHTSYGCGAKSPLTFFGQAMYVDALNNTWSFTRAHAQARELIDTREKAAGKSDGYSNPQIREGARIRELLDRLEAQQSSAASDAPR